MVPNQEEIISLKEITGYTGNIAAASIASSSTLNVVVLNEISRDYNLVINTVSPTQMHEYFQEQMPQYQSHHDVTGSNV
ncbi:MAG: hypothetical protein QXZ70_01560, partial [Candidatus Bathyarchaeia archaeon]